MVYRFCPEAPERLWGERMREYRKADARNPHMGLNNRICRNPEYWCKLHQVWLSENDVAKKQCKHKPTFDMMGTVSQVRQSSEKIGLGERTGEKE